MFQNLFIYLFICFEILTSVADIMYYLII